MTAIIDINNDSHNQDDEILFGRISNDLQNKGYSINVNALPFSLANALYQHISLMSDESFKAAATGRDQEYMKNIFVRSQKLSWIMGESPVGANWLHWANALQTYLNRHLFLGLFSFESHYARYSRGDFYKRHYDVFKGETSRKLSIVVYLNRHWLSDDGGELVLYQSDKDKVGLKVIPSFATVVAFLSSEYPHEVLRTHRDRYSIAGWYSPNTTTTSRVDPPR
ncbi:MAG: SM-20-related protein [Saprospiraceae bacterium]|jgi:SM-20-related protein